MIKKMSVILSKHLGKGKFVISVEKSVLIVTRYCDICQNLLISNLLYVYVQSIVMFSVLSLA